MRSPTLLFLVAVLGLSLLGSSSFETSSNNKSAVEAARQNNLGVAYMNQQLFEKGLKNFEAAIAADPEFSLGRLNRAIALLNLQRVDEAKALLDGVVQGNPKNPTAWYNLGLLYKNSGDVEKAVNAFHHVVVMVFAFVIKRCRQLSTALQIRQTKRLCPRG